MVFENQKAHPTFLLSLYGIVTIAGTRTSSLHCSFKFQCSCNTTNSEKSAMFMAVVYITGQCGGYLVIMVGTLVTVVSESNSHAGRVLYELIYSGVMK